MNVVSVDPPGFELLASDALLESVSKALQSGPQATETLLFVSGAAALMLLILLLARFFSREPSQDAERRVDYLTLAVDLLGLSESDRRDLQRVASRARLKEPAAMLLSPANLAAAAAVAFATDKDKLFRRRIERLCVRLFETPLPEPGSSPRQVD